jgi:2-phosphoglycerate kinase
MEPPYIILLGGATGVGHSTIAFKLSELYPVRGFQRTDTIREVLRMALSPYVNPEIFVSSYKAHQHLDSIYKDPQIMPRNEVVLGHIRQMECVFLGVESAISRDVRENINSIYEGVHIWPGKLKQAEWYNKSHRQKIADAYKKMGFELLRAEEYDKHVIEVLIDIENPEMHKKRFLQREIYSPLRPSDKYLDNMKNIRLIRDFLVDQANINGIPIIQNVNLEDAVNQCIAEITKKTDGKFLPKK